MVFYLEIFRVISELWRLIWLCVAKNILTFDCATNGDIDDDDDFQIVSYQWTVLFYKYSVCRKTFRHIYIYYAYMFHHHPPFGVHNFPFIRRCMKNLVNCAFMHTVDNVNIPKFSRIENENEHSRFVWKWIAWQNVYSLLCKVYICNCGCCCWFPCNIIKVSVLSNQYKAIYIISNVAFYISPFEIEKWKMKKIQARQADWMCILFMNCCTYFVCSFAHRRTHERKSFYIRHRNKLCFFQRKRYGMEWNFEMYTKPLVAMCLIFLDSCIRMADNLQRHRHCFRISPWTNKRMKHNIRTYTHTHTINEWKCCTSRA